MIAREFVLEDLRRAVTGSLDAELIHPVAKRVWMKIQDPRCALWTMNHSTGMLKGGEDMISLYLVQCEEWLWRLEVCLPIIWNFCLRSLDALTSGDNRHQVAVQPESRAHR